MKKPETLIVITPAFPENEAATWWVPSQQLMVKALQESFPGIKLSVLSLLYPHHREQYTWHGIEVQAFDGMHHRKWKRLWLWKKVWKHLRVLQQENEVIGLLSFWNGECAFFGQHFGKRHGIPHISWICGQDAKKENRWVRFIRPRANQLAAMSAFLRDQYASSHGVRPEHLVPNAIDPSSFITKMPAVREYDIMGAGSFEPLKQYELLVEVTGALRERFPAIKAVHCGMGREQVKVEEVIRRLQLQSNISLLGGRAHEEVLSLMQRSKVFLHTSRYEGCSTVCLEALYAGAHVVSFCYPFEEPVPHWHVVKDKSEMIAKAYALLADPDTKYTPVILQDMRESARMMMELFTI